MTEDVAGSTRRIWWPWITFGLATLALLFRPLLGLGALLPTDIPELFAPWRYAPTSGNEQLANPLLSDTLDVHRQRQLFPTRIAAAMPVRDFPAPHGSTMMPDRARPSAMGQQIISCFCFGLQL